MSCKAFKFIFSSDERNTGQVSDLFGNSNSITFWCIDACTYSSTTQSQLAQVRQCIIDSTQTMIQLRYITAQLLTNGKWCCIHKVSTADLYHMHELLCLTVKGITQFFDTGNRGFQQHFIGSNVHRCRERVV